MSNSDQSNMRGNPSQQQPKTGSDAQKAPNKSDSQSGKPSMGNRASNENR